MVMANGPHLHMQICNSNLMLPSEGVQTEQLIFSLRIIFVKKNKKKK